MCYGAVKVKHGSGLTNTSAGSDFASCIACYLAICWSINRENSEPSGDGTTYLAVNFY